MKKLNRVLVLLLLAVPLALLLASVYAPAPQAGPTPAKPIVIKASHGYPAGKYVLNLIHLKFEELTEKYTDGRVQVDVYPTAQLFPAREEIEACARGDIQFISTPNAFSSAYQPWYVIMDIPFLFKDFGHFARFMAHPKVAKLHRESWKAKGLKVFPFVKLEMLYCLWTKDRPLTKMEDFQGLKFRALHGVHPFLKAWGASGMLIEAAEIPTAVGTGMVDGVQLTPDFVARTKLYTKLRHGPPEGTYFISSGGADLLMPLKFWNSLPKDIQDIIENKVIPEVLAFGKTQSGEAAKEAYKVFRGEGMQFAWFSDAEIGRMKAVAAPLVKDMLKKGGALDLLPIARETEKP